MQKIYTDFLIDEFIERKGNNPQYSERAFARQLGLSPGFLKLLFQGKKNLSIQRGQEVALKLNWSELKKKKFLSAIHLNASKKSRHKMNKYFLDEKDFFEISDWFYFAIVEYLKIKNRKNKNEDLSRALGISFLETAFALKNLSHLGLIKKIGESQFELAASYEIPSIQSESIRKYHRQMLELAKSAIDQQDFDKRDFRGHTLAFESSKITEVKTWIEQMVTDFESKFKTDKPDSVYQLTTAFFRLDRGEK